MAEGLDYLFPTFDDYQRLKDIYLSANVFITMNANHVPYKNAGIYENDLENLDEVVIVGFDEYSYINPYFRIRRNSGVIWERAMYYRSLHPISDIGGVSVYPTSLGKEGIVLHPLKKL